MAERGEQRRLAAIFAADMVGYSRLMEADERATIARQKAHRADLIDPAIAEHHGRIVKLMGDGMLVEFASVVDAVECAMAIQRAMAEREADVPDDRRIRYRVGINLGDIVIEGEDIFGDGVNIAARLQEIAEPGGVCISGTAFDHLKAKVEAGYEYQGEQQVKNIAEPVRVYRALLDPQEAGKLIGIGQNRRLPWAAVAAAIAVLVAITGGAWWWQPWSTSGDTTDNQSVNQQISNRPSIAVLPFENLSGDESQNALVAGLGNDIGAALSKLSELFVVSGGAAKSFREKAVSPQEIGRALGVRYVLRGNVERAGETLRIQALLIDGSSGANIWSERYERNLEDIFAIRDEVTLNVVSEVGASISQGERDRIMRRGTQSLEAWLLVREAAYRISLLAPEHVQPAEEMAKRAIEIDPNYAAAYAALSGVYRQQGQNWPGDKSRKELFALSEKLAKKALELDPDLDYGHLRMATLHLARAEHDQAVASIKKAVGLMPNNWINQGVMGWIMNHANRPNKGLSHLKLAMRLNPNFPYWAAREVGHSYMLMGQSTKALKWYEKTIEMKPDRVTEMLARVRSAVIYHELGREDAAREQIAKAMAVYPRTSLAFLHRSRPYRDPAIYAKWDPILRNLGIPERGPDDK